MELLQSIDPGHLPLIAAGCALLCLALVVIGFALQAVSGLIELVVGIFQAVADVAQGGPTAWLGCLFLVGALLACGIVAFLLLNAPESCAAQPTNFCRWLGFVP